MAEVQDEDHWLYGDDKVENSADRKVPTTEPDSATSETQPNVQDDASSQSKAAAPPETTETNGEVNDTTEKDKKDGQEDTQEADQNGEKAKTDADDDSNSDDEPTVTIGKIVKQPDIMRPPPPTHRAAPTTGLKDEDFATVGKINGVPATDYNLAELEEKPWRKPGADLSDYFNYGFTEDTWMKYCERQKAMRTNESGIGLIGLGINIGRSMLGSSNIPVSIVNENSKYGGMRKPAGMPIIKTKIGEDDGSGMNQNLSVNTIQVMTADRRTYSNKVLANVGGPNAFDDMDFGGNPYGDFFNTPPPPNFYTPPPPAGPWGGIPNIPPPGWGPGGLGGPPPMPHHRGGMGYFEEESMSNVAASSRSSKEERERDREIEKISREMVEPRLSREQESSRHHSSRRRTRSRSKSRHRRRSRSKSRSRSPSHRHKRKKSKREREAE